MFIHDGDSVLGLMWTQKEMEKHHLQLNFCFSHLQKIIDFKIVGNREHRSNEGTFIVVEKALELVWGRSKLVFQLYPCTAVWPWTIPCLSLLRFSSTSSLELQSSMLLFSLFSKFLAAILLFYFKKWQTFLRCLIRCVWLCASPSNRATFKDPREHKGRESQGRHLRKGASESMP